MHQRALAGAVLAGDGDRFAGLDMQVQVLQRGRTAGIGETNAIEGDFAAHRRQAAARVKNLLRLFGQHALQALQGAARLLGLAVDTGQRSDRARQHGGVEEETDQFARRHVAAADAFARQPEQDEHGERGNELNRRFERGLDPVLADAEADDALDLLAVALGFPSFPRERLDGRQHAEVFFGHADGGGMFFLQLAGQRAQLAPDDLEQQIKERNGCGDRQPQQRIGAQHHQYCARHRQQERDQAEQGAGDVT